MDYRAVYETLKSPKEIEKLLSDPKQTATALLAVKYGIFESTGINLSFNLMALSKLLSEHPSAWNVVDNSLIDKIVQVSIAPEQESNVTCPALSVLTLITLESRKCTRQSLTSIEQIFTNHPQFYESIVSKLISSNVQIIHSALQFINATLLTFVISKSTLSSNTPVGLPQDSGVRSYFFENLREAGLLRNASQLFENKPIAASCSPQLYDLQEIVRAIFCLNQRTEIDIQNNTFHNQTFKQVESRLVSLLGTTQEGNLDYQRAGLLENQDPVSEFNNSLKWSGLQDFTDFLGLDEMVFKKLYLEHLAFADPDDRFPFVSASMAVSEIMYAIFGVSNHKLSSEYLDGVPESLVPPQYIESISTPTHTTSEQFSFGTTNTKVATSMLDFGDSVSTSSSLHKPNSSVETELAKLGKLRPLIFDWGLLHSAGIINFLRLWLSSSAQREDFENLIQVVNVLFSQAIPNNDFSTISVDSVISKLDSLSYADIRAIQLRNIEEDLNTQWGSEIRSLHNQFHQESYDFVKEQRIRLLLRGEWFYVDNPTQASGAAAATNGPSLSTRGATGGSRQQATNSVAVPTSRRYFIALSPSLSTLHYSEYTKRTDEYPAFDELSRTIDLAAVSKVVVTSLTSKTQRKNRLRVHLQSRTNYSRLSLMLGGASRDSSALTFYTDTPEKAAAWGDGLLMVKNKAYQSMETKKYIDMFAETKLQLQMMHITPDDLGYVRRNYNVPNATDYETVNTDGEFFYL